ncbi:MAG TPA: alpha/beta hydrolase [Candidatus Obscuribacterales bacterium]
MTSTLPDIVLLHGTGSSGDMWLRQIEFLSRRGHRCFVIDLRGHGQSDEPGHKTDIETHLADVLETLKQTDVRHPAVFVGHSLGSIISLVIAERRPEMVARVFAAAMPGRIFKPMVHGFRWFLDVPYTKLRGTEFHAKLAWRERTLLNTPRHTLEQIVDNFADLNFVDRPLKVTCPVHFSVGRFDPVAPCFFVEKMHKSLPKSTLKIYEWSGHNFMDLQHESFNRWLDEHLREHESEKSQQLDSQDTERTDANRNKKSAR